jgi:hypothetical protein
MKRLLFTWPVFVIGLTVGLLGLIFVPEPEYNETPLDDVFICDYSTSTKHYNHHSFAS